MTQSTHALIERFFAGLGSGTLTDDLFAADMKVWTLSSKQDAPGEVYRGGTRVLASLFPEGLCYTVKAITAEDDRAVAEASAEGRLESGDEYRNDYVFVFRLRDGKIVRLEEYFDPRPVDELIIPRIMAAMAKPTD